MRIAHHLMFSPTEVVGGIEVYVQYLVRGLRRFGVESECAAPADVPESRVVEHDGVRVLTYPRMWSGERIADWRRADPSLAAFRRWLETGRFDVFHLHGWAAHINASHARVVRALGLPLVITTHDASWTCARGTVMHRGVELCDGVLRAGRCAACLGWGRGGVSGRVRNALARLPPVLGELVMERMMPRLARQRVHEMAVSHARTHTFLAAARHARVLVAVSGWMRDLYVASGLPAERVRLVRHGVSTLPAETPPPPPSGDVLEIGFIGRLNEAKGVRVLVHAVRALPREVRVRLVIHGVANWPFEIETRDTIMALAREDARIVCRGPLQRDGMWRLMAGIDVLAVPAQGFESGPLVVHEANAAGTPVLGTGFGGIAELVREGENGWLVPLPACLSVEGWTQALARLAADLPGVRAARARIGPPRTMDDVARDMLAIYREAAGRPVTSG